MTERILRTSERSAFLRCQWMWWMAYREGLASTGVIPNHFWFGIGIHEALAAWYCGPGAKRGAHPAETWAAYAKDSIETIKTEAVSLDDEAEAKWVEAEKLGTILMEEYVKHYGRDEHKLYIKAEKTFALDIPWPTNQTLYDDLPTGVMLRYVGKTDGVWRHADTGQIVLDEHKTEKSPVREHLELDPQAGSYWAILPRFLQSEGLLGPKEKIAAIDYNFIRKALPDTRPRDDQGYYTNLPQKSDYMAAFEGHPIGQVPASLNKMKLDELARVAQELGLTVLGARSKIQPPPLFERVMVPKTTRERKQELIQIQQEAMHMEAVREGILPALKNRTRDCKFCQFVDMCKLHQVGGNWEDYRDAAYTRRDPYADHREAGSSEQV